MSKLHQISAKTTGKYQKCGLRLCLTISQPALATLLPVCWPVSSIMILSFVVAGLSLSITKEITSSSDITCTNSGHQRKSPWKSLALGSHWSCGLYNMELLTPGQGNTSGISLFEGMKWRRVEEDSSCDFIFILCIKDDVISY